MVIYYWCSSADACCDQGWSFHCLCLSVGICLDLWLCSFLSGSLWNSRVIHQYQSSHVPLCLTLFHLRSHALFFLYYCWQLPSFLYMSYPRALNFGFCFTVHLAGFHSPLLCSGFKLHISPYTHWQDLLCFAKLILVVWYDLIFLLFKCRGRCA